MPEVTLQDYIKEIEGMIEEARYLEALAHLRHILGHYPRYAEAYFLLGKTMLEAELPALAANLFRRTLNADPEHEMARIGLATCYEQLDNLNGAIWNLERAYELMPGNEALAEELCRLYGRRDGLVPKRPPMTRAGLARLYLRGGLYGRAIEELRALTAKEPNRPDLLLPLAEAYWREDQIVQASSTCQHILDYLLN